MQVSRALSLCISSTLPPKFQPPHALPPLISSQLSEWLYFTWVAPTPKPPPRRRQGHCRLIVPFLSGITSQSAGCLMSENSCFLCFVPFSSCFWWDGISNSVRQKQKLHLPFRARKTYKVLRVAAFFLGALSMGVHTSFPKCYAKGLI